MNSLINSSSVVGGGETSVQKGGGFNQLNIEGQGQGSVVGLYDKIKAI